MSTIANTAGIMVPSVHFQDGTTPESNRKPPTFNPAFTSTRARIDFDIEDDIPNQKIVINYMNTREKSGHQTQNDTLPYFE